MNKLFVMLPCYNEEHNISDLIDNWIAQKDFLLSKGYELQINPIDDCSTDATKSIMLEKHEQYPFIVTPIFHSHNMNLGGGINTSLGYFLDNGNESDLMCIMDGDNSHDPKYIQNLLPQLQNGVECVIASRYCKGSKIFGVPLHRILMSYMARVYYTILLRVPNVKDYTCGYRLYKYQAVKRLAERFKNPIIEEKSFACMMELLYKLYLTGTKFDEIGFILRYDNKRGNSKMKVLSTTGKSLSMALKLQRFRKEV